MLMASSTLCAARSSSPIMNIMSVCRPRTDWDLQPHALLRLHVVVRHEANDLGFKSVRIHLVLTVNQHPTTTPSRHTHWTMSDSAALRQLEIGVTAGRGYAFAQRRQDVPRRRINHLLQNRPHLGLKRSTVTGGSHPETFVGEVINLPDRECDHGNRLQ